MVKKTADMVGLGPAFQTPCLAMPCCWERTVSRNPVGFLLAIETVPAFGLAAWIVEDAVWVSVEIQTAVHDGKAEEKHR